VLVSSIIIAQALTDSWSELLISALASVEADWSTFTRSETARGLCAWKVDRSDRSIHRAAELGVSIPAGFMSGQF
jgi:hypothetical protein